MMKYICITVLVALVSCILACSRQTSARPPYRDEIAPPSGCSRSGEVWNEIPTNVANAVRVAIQTKGYDLRQYWDPEVKKESGKWFLLFQGTMPDPGFHFSVTFESETKTVHIEPGA
jgi:hypothetical protein